MVNGYIPITSWGLEWFLQPEHDMALKNHVLSEVLVN